MKRFLKLTAAFLFMTALFISPAQAGYLHYTIDVYKDIGYTSGPFAFPHLTTGVQYLVLDSGADGHEANTVKSTLYNDRGLTTKANPTNTDTFDAHGKIEFYVSDSADSYDIIIVDNAGGYTLYMNDVEPSTHSAVIDERPNLSHQGTIWFSLNTDTIWSGISTSIVDIEHSPTGPWDSGIDIATQTMITDVILEIIVPCRDSADSGQTFIGLGPSATALFGGAVGAMTDDPGFVATVWIDATSTYGDILYESSSAMYTTAVGGDGVEVKTPGITTSTTSLNYIITSGDGSSDSADNDFGWGFFHWWFYVLGGK